MIAIVIPCYNEASRFNLSWWQETIRKFENCFWIFVNDGSTDDTRIVLNQIKDERVRIIGYDMNLGKGEAVRFGFNFILKQQLNSNFSLIGYLDADNSFGVGDIIGVFNESLEKIQVNEKFDIVVGSRVKLAGRNIIRDNYRHYLGRVITTLVCSGWKSAPYDTQSGFKIFRLNKDFKESIENPFLTKWFFDIELLLRLESLKPLRIWELPVMTWHEIKSNNFSLRKFYDIIIQIFKAKLLVMKHLKSMRRY